MPLSSGSYFGPYRLLEKLASHQDADTWWVEHQGQTLRLRMLHRSRNGGNDAFLRAGEAMKGLTGAGVAKIIDLGVQDEVAYWVCEHLPGRNFRKVFEDPQVGVFRRFELLEAAASVVAAAHNVGLVHGRLRPANLFELPNGSVKLTDFGVETYRPDPPIPGPAVPDYVFLRYVAPERIAAQSDEGSKASDVWAMGMMLFEALAGRYPFPCDDLLPMLTAIQEQPLPMELLGEDVPPPVKELIAWCLQREPSARPQDGAALVGAMARARRGENPKGIVTANAFEGTAVLPVTGSEALRTPSGAQPAAMPSGVQPAAMPSGAQPAAMSSGAQPAAMPSGTQPAAASTTGASPQASQPQAVYPAASQPQAVHPGAPQPGPSEEPTRRWIFFLMPLAALLSAALVWGIASLIAPSEQPVPVGTPAVESAQASGEPEQASDGSEPSAPEVEEQEEVIAAERPRSHPMSRQATPTPSPMEASRAAPRSPSPMVHRASMRDAQHPAQTQRSAQAQPAPMRPAASPMLPPGVTPAPMAPMVVSGRSNAANGAAPSLDAPGYGHRSGIRAPRNAIHPNRVAAGFERLRGRFQGCVHGMRGSIDFRARYVGGAPIGRIQVSPSSAIRHITPCIERHLMGFRAPGASGEITYRMRFPR